MLGVLTSRSAAKWFAIGGIALFALCLLLAARQTFYAASDPTDGECNAHLKDPPDAVQSPKIGAGQLHILGIWPTATTVNRHICVAVGGVVSKATEERTASEVERAQKGRDEAQTSYDAAIGTAKDAAWEKLQRATTALATALAAAASQPQPVDLSVFLNGKTVPDLKIKAYAKSDPQILLIRLRVPPSAGDSGAAFWRELLSATSSISESDTAAQNETKIGQKTVAVGLSRSAATMPEATSDEKLTVVVYDPWTLVVGIASFVCLAIGFCGLARHTTLLRDNAQTEVASRVTSNALDAARVAETEARTKVKDATDAAIAAKRESDATKAAVARADASTKAQATENAAKAGSALKIAEATRTAAEAALTGASTTRKAAEDEAVDAAKAGDVEQPLGPYSLARTQMAFWLILTLAGFVFIWLSMGLYLGLITGGILVLLGINAATGLTSVSLNDENDKTSISKSFFEDILSDGNGFTLHRIQIIAWTAILGIIFIWNVFWNFTFVDFDTNLLLLIGVAQSMYLGFKWQEAPAKQK